METQNYIKNILHEGQEIKNYVELCALLNVPVLDGGQKKKQLEDLQRYFDYQKDGRKFIVTQIYDEPVSKEYRIAANAKYVGFIQNILLSYLSKQKKETVYLTQHNLWTILGMVNEKYFPASQNREQLLELDEDMNIFNINDFFKRSSLKFRDIIKRSLDSLKRRQLIIYDDIYMIAESHLVNNKEELWYREASDNERRYIMKKKREVLTSLGYDDEFQIFFSKQKEKYYTLLSEKYDQERNWKVVYSCYKFIFDTKNIIDAINADKEAKEMNVLVLEALNTQALNNYENKGITASNAELRKQEEKEPFFYHEEYPRMQLLLSNNLIKK